MLALSIDEAISIEEYREAKNTLVLERHQRMETLTKIEKGVYGRFEQLRELTNVAQQATCVLDRDDAVETVRFFKSVGLNMTLRDGRLSWEPRGAWQLLVGQQLVQMGGSESGSDLARVSAQDREEQIKRGRENGS